MGIMKGQGGLIQQPPGKYGVIDWGRLALVGSKSWSIWNLQPAWHLKRHPNSSPRKGVTQVIRAAQSIAIFINNINHLICIVWFPKTVNIMTPVFPHKFKPAQTKKNHQFLPKQSPNIPPTTLNFRGYTVIPHISRDENLHVSWFFGVQGFLNNSTQLTRVSQLFLFL